MTNFDHSIERLTLDDAHEHRRGARARSADNRDVRAGSSASAASKAHSSPPHQSKMERRMSHFKEYKFFRSFSAKVENWPMRKAEQLWRKMRERKIAGKFTCTITFCNLGGETSSFSNRQAEIATFEIFF